MKQFWVDKNGLIKNACQTIDRKIFSQFIVLAGTFHQFIHQLKYKLKSLPLHTRITSMLALVLSVGLIICSIIAYYLVSNSLQPRFFTTTRPNDLFLKPPNSAYNIYNNGKIIELYDASDLEKMGQQIAGQAHLELQKTLIVYLVITTIIIVLIGTIIAYCVSHRELNQLKQGYDRLEQFAGDASHELRTPLSIIKGQASLYRMKARSGRLNALEIVSEAEFTIGKINYAADQMSEIVNSLLDLTRISSTINYVKENIQLQKLINNTIVNLKGFSQNWAISIHDPQQIVLRTNHGLLQRIFTNIFSNIMKYTSVGIAVEIYISKIGNSVRIIIVDHGEGVTDIELSHLFERFWTASTSRNREETSTGLGLAIVKNAVETMGGTIVASHTLNGGLTYTITL